MLLLDSAGREFPGELIAGPTWSVRFQRPPKGGEWVIELLALVEGWLHNAPLPCAWIRHGGRTYLFRAPLDAA
jgi:hypothetical protein